MSRATFDGSPFAYRPREEIESYLRETLVVRERLKPVYNLKAAEEQPKHGKRGA